MRLPNVEMRNGTIRVILLCMLVMVCFAGRIPLHAGTPTNWWTGLVTYNGGAGSGIGVLPGTHDGWDGGAPMYIGDYPGTAVYLYLRRTHSSDWAGETGFYAEDYEAPIPAGGSKTWWDFYLWSHNYTPDPPGQIEVRNVYEASVDEGPPTGYMGHLVIDQVATGVTWTGPMDYWFDMTQFNTFTLPIATVTDPLQGTRFHLTVYAPPIPEPSSLAALAVGVLPLGAALMRRRKR